MLAGVCRGARSANSCLVRPWMLMTLKSAHRIVCTPENVVVEKRTTAMPCQNEKPDRSYLRLCTRHQPQTAALLCLIRR